jgi:hypothetical protein
MSNKQQTAVEWLKKQLEDYGSNSHLTLDWDTFDELFDKAKEMEKEQKMKDYFQGRKDESSSKARYEYNRNSEQWYNETYGGNK